jgi:hypothetical protein
MSHHQICFFSTYPNRNGTLPLVGICAFLSGHKRNGRLSKMRNLVVRWGSVVVRCYHKIKIHGDYTFNH